MAPAPDADARVRATRGLRAVAANPTANVDAMSRRAGAFVALPRLPTLGLPIGMLPSD